MKIGTRGSMMALLQTAEVERRLKAAHRGLGVEAVQSSPAGDRDQISKLETHGGKGGAFVAEIRAAMLAGELDCAMHSLKDMPGDREAPGLVIAAYLAREDAADALVLRDDATEASLAAGGRIGTNAVRRAAYLKRLYPQAEIIHFRGAADTRLRKLDERTPQRLADGGETAPADALVLSASGLARIDQAARIARRYSPDEMLPAVGQGIIAVECPRDDWETRKLLGAIDDKVTRAAAEAEREMLWILNGHCNAPIAGHARVDVATLHLRGAVMSLDGATLIEAARSGPLDRPRELGRAIGLELVEKGARAVIDAARG